MENIRIRYLTVSDAVRIAREKGYVVGNVVMDGTHFIMLCHSLGFRCDEVFREVIGV